MAKPHTQFVCQTCGASYPKWTGRCANCGHTQFVCQTCGASYPKWTGRCANCGTWNSLVEQLPEPARDEKSAVGRSQLLTSCSAAAFSLVPSAYSPANPALASPLS